MRVAILGCGMQGRRVAYHLASSDIVSGLVVADKNKELALKVASKIGAKAVGQQVDISERNSLETILGEVDIVFNGVGPFYKYAIGVIEAAIAQKTHYVDINDDYDVAEELFLKSDYDAQAKQAGVTVLCCMGAAPGLSNILSRYGSQQLQRVKAIHIYFSYPYWRGPASVTDHMLHCLTGEVTQYLGGRYTKVKAFGGKEIIKFLAPSGSMDSVETYYCGHSEPITLPRYIPGVEEVTVKLSCYQPEAKILFHDLVKYGFSNRNSVTGLAESPVDYISQYMASPEGAPYFEMELTEEDGLVMQIEVVGESNGQGICLVYEMHDKDARTIAASATIAIEGLIRGEISARGVVAPEGCVDTVSFLPKITRYSGVSLYEKRSVVGCLYSQRD